MMTDIEQLARKMVEKCPHCGNMGTYFVEPDVVKAMESRRFSDDVIEEIKQRNRIGLEEYRKYRLNVDKPKFWKWFSPFQIHFNEWEYEGKPGIKKCHYCGEMRDLLGIPDEEPPKHLVDHVNEWIAWIDKLEENHEPKVQG